MESVGIFAGIGAIEEGLRRAGHRTAMLCENDEAASLVLSKRFPNVPLHSDVRTLKALPKCDIVSAGFPCTDLSQAGLTKGIRGRSSGLVFELFRLLRSAKQEPTWLVLENVAFMLKLKRGQAMRSLAKQFNELGWKWAYRTIDSRSFGLPHRRRRVVIVASSTEDPRRVLFADNDATWPDRLPTSAESYGFYWTEGNRGVGWAIGAVPALKGGSGLAIPSPPAIWFPKTRSFGTPDVHDTERLQGLEAGWTKPAEALATGARQRWRLVGNAVTAPVFDWVGRRLANPGDPILDTQTSFDPSESWPDAGWGDRRSYFRVNAAEAPLAHDHIELTAFLNKPVTPLSSRAASGFLFRLLRSGLRVGDQFVRDLKEYVGEPELCVARQSP